MRKQTQIAYIRHESLYKPLEVKTNRTFFPFGNRNRHRSTQLQKAKTHTTVINVTQYFMAIQDARDPSFNVILSLQSSACNEKIESRGRHSDCMYSIGIAILFCKTYATYHEKRRTTQNYRRSWHGTITLLF